MLLSIREDICLVKEVSVFVLEEVLSAHPNVSTQPISYWSCYLQLITSGNENLESSIRKALPALLGTVETILGNRYMSTWTRTQKDRVEDTSTCGNW